ncbi:MAG: T9SS type A sorting domain-containing protein [Bacteroidota bacterium]
MIKKFYKKSLATLLSLMLFVSAFSQGTWIQKTDFGGTARYGTVSFTIGTKAYVGLGIDGALKNDFWVYDQITGLWSPIAPFPGAARYEAVAFAIGNKGYVGTGAAGTAFPYTPHYADFWEYDPANNQWNPKAAFPGTARFGSVGFSIGTKGYIGTGFDAFTYFQNDFWEYDQPNNQWNQIAPLPGLSRMEAAGFSIGNKGYIGTGGNFMVGVLLNDFWEYDTTNNQWTQRTDFGGTVRNLAVGFSIGDNGYIGIGGDFSSVAYPDFWEYNQGNNQWTQITNFGSTGRWLSTGFAIGNKGYFTTGGNFTPTYKDLWEYTPTTTGISGSDFENELTVLSSAGCGKFQITNTKYFIERINVFNVAGENIYSQSISSHTADINITESPTGIYFVQIVNVKSVVTKKIIITK